MTLTLRMPDLGTVEGSVTLVRWLRCEGQPLTRGEPLFEVETDKGVSEVESVAGGTLTRQLIAEGSRVAAGEPIALVETAEASVAASAPPSPAAARPVPPSLAALARKHGIDLSRLKGTGTGGAVTRTDILQARGTGTAPSAPPPSAPTPSAPASSSPPELSPQQSVVAARVAQSHREKPVFHVTARADMSRVISARAAQPALSFDAFLVKACAVALSEAPSFRRWMAGTEIRRHEAVDVALAVDVEDDLAAPVIRNPAASTLDDISRQIDRLVLRARQRALGPGDSRGGCFLVSNLGMFPSIESFDAVILPEHSAALAVGTVVPTPVVTAEGTGVAPLSALTLTVDHRLINGAAAARFLGRVKKLLEEGCE